jgi:hypothetical protein
MKTYLSFNDQSEDDREKLKMMMQAMNMHIALHEIGQEVFRPHRKHGYRDNERLNELLSTEKSGEAVSEAVYEAISILEKMFYEIVSDNNVTDL